MIRRKQLFRHDPDNGVYGDCHRTAFACLLELEPADVPHFNEGGPSVAEFRLREQEWLASHGLYDVHIACRTLEDALSLLRITNPGVHCLLGGTSRNGCGHSVIACDGEIVWDPAQDDSGIVGPMEDGYFWLTFLVPLITTKKAA